MTTAVNWCCFQSFLGLDMSDLCIQHHIVFNVFIALHSMQTRYSDENSNCPSVCLSVRLSNA